ncbi:MAG: SemiSWEET family transporter [Dehalococcoidales bacterium]|jgi:MtN3 and saliva related transmembrane protein
MEFSFWTIVGIVAALLTSFSYIPQLRKMWVRRSAKDVSNITMLQLMIGCALWLIYGVFRRDMIIIGANVVAVISLAIGLALYYRYRVKGE